MKKIEKIPFRKGTAVGWKWLGRLIQGKVVEVHSATIEKMIKGKKIKRKGSAVNPAYVVESAAGNRALKLHSELVQIEKRSASSPRLFSDDEQD